jgi:predicted Zn-dependent protease
VTGLLSAEAVVETALAEAAPGSDGCMVLVEDIEEVDVRFACNTVTTNGERRDRRVTVVVVRDAGSGSGSGAAAGVASAGGAVDVAALVAAARVDALAAAPAEDAAPLVGPDEVAGPALDAARRRFGVAAGTTGFDVLAPVVGHLRASFGEASTAGRVLAGFAEHRVTTTSLGTSTGVRLAHEQPTGAVQMVGRRADGGASAWVGRGTPDFADVDAAAMAAELARRLAWADRRLELPAGRYEVVLPPEAVADLMIDLAWNLSGRAALDGRSPFSAPGGVTRVGERISPLPFRLAGDPGAPGLACRPFAATTASSSDGSVFDNGLPLAPTAWVDDGHLRNLRFHRAGAEQAGTVARPWIDNLVLEVPEAEASLDEMVAGTERGLLVTCLWYLREVDPATMLLTGLTRDGVAVVEDGRIVGTTTNFRFNESPLDLLARATEAGASVRALGRESGEYVNRTRMPALRVPDFNMSSTSQAS